VLALLVIASRADEAPLPLPEATGLRFGSVSVYSENDKYLAGTDEYYTNGFKLSSLSTNLRDFIDAPVPYPVRQVARLLDPLVPPDRDYKLGLSIGQNLYTPGDTDTTASLFTDRPYAAWLYLGACFQSYRPAPAAGGARSGALLDTLELTLGMVGPSALGRQVQNGFHHLIGAATANGWNHQIHDEPGLNLVYQRKYRLSTLHAGDGWGADIIPHAGLSLGNIFTYLNAGAEIRAGWRLAADFGTDLIHPSGDSNSRRRPPWSVFFFAATDGRAVARDITLDGNSFRKSARVDKKTLVADLFGGVAIGTMHWQLTYTENLRTREFDGQQKSAVFGSISITLFY
jgi:lipid A 3-O-deacylase